MGLLILKRLARMQTYPTSRRVREKWGPGDAQFACALEQLWWFGSFNSRTVHFVPVNKCHSLKKSPLLEKREKWGTLSRGSADKETKGWAPGNVPPFFDERKLVIAPSVPSFSPQFFQFSASPHAWEQRSAPPRRRGKFPHRR